MSANRSEIHTQLVDVLDGVDFPVSSRAEIERQFGPREARTRIESGDFSMTLQAVGNAVRGSDAFDYPYRDAESLAEAAVAALEQQGHL